ncbi:hypothetical protein [Streptomyces sp. NPDC010273]|uniref:hypothetical protein n=1 Tax=Streptomyces sp. NPDC010273 TaxID=3364829 RepID=UPI0036E4C527
MTRPPSAPQLPVPTAKFIAPPDITDSTLLDVSSSPQMSLGSSTSQATPMSSSAPSTCPTGHPAS